MNAPHYVPVMVLELAGRHMRLTGKPAVAIAATPAEQYDWRRIMRPVVQADGVAVWRCK